MSNRVLSVLVGFIIKQSKSYLETNLGYQGIVKAIKEWLSNKVLAAIQYAVLKHRLIDCVYKTGTKYASKSEIELVVFETFREFLLAVLVLGLGVAVLVGKLLDGFSLVHTVIYGAHKQSHKHNNKMS